MTKSAAHAVVMGVSGTGKSVVGSAVADSLGAVFIDADDLHPIENKERMRAGKPLTDVERLPWLAVVAERMAAAGEDRVVVACSALRRSYRDILRAGTPDAFFLHLDAPVAVIAGRLAAREHEFMPADLLASQLQDLEALDPDEHGVVVDVDRPLDEIVAEAVAVLGNGRPAS